jgi:hypothetical protein
MDDIRREDRRLFLRESLKPGRLILVALILAAVLAMKLGPATDMPFTWFLGFLLTPVLIHLLNARNEARAKRFRIKRFEALWNGCQDRLDRFEEVLGQMRKDKIADLQEMPQTIRRVASALYAALRRADIITTEVQKTEQGIYAQPPVWNAPANDPQAKELYRIADRNIAEYRAQFAGVMAGVQRAEAQSAVFMTTLDTLRMKMIGYRLVGRSPEMQNSDFLYALNEAKLQLQAIDKALEELDFDSPDVRLMPPPPPAVARDEHLGQGG